MPPRIVHAEWRHGHTIFVRFAQGPEGEIDLSGELEGEVFEPLRDEALFAELELDESIRTVCWPGGADFAPEFLLAKLEKAARGATAGSRSGKRARTRRSVRREV